MSFKLNKQRENVNNQTQKITVDKTERMIDKEIEEIINAADDETKQRSIELSVVYQFLKPLFGTNNEITLSDYSKAIERLYISLRNPFKVAFAKFHKNQRKSSRWLREISKNIELHRKEVERQINARLGLSKDNHTILQIRISNSKLYFWQRDLDPNNWLISIGL
ncbi:MAG: hypothetical protein ACFFCH_11870 [Promethearchaeota archaeon]